MTESWESTYGEDYGLVEAAQSGSTEALGVLVDRYHPQLMRYLLRQTGDRETAADLAQETFLDACRHLDRLQDDRPFAAWLYRIAHNHLLAHRRKARVWRLISLDWMTESAQGLMPAFSRPDASGAGRARRGPAGTRHLESGTAGGAAAVRAVGLQERGGSTGTRDLPGSGATADCPCYRAVPRAIQGNGWSR